MHITLFEQKLQRLNVIILFVSAIYTYLQTICYSLQTMQIVLYALHHIINLFCLPKEKDLTLPLNLTLMTVIIYTGNKVKSNRGEEKRKGFN